MAALTPADIIQGMASHFSAATRLYALEAGTWPLTELQVERWQGREALSQGFDLSIDTLSTQSGLPLDAMIGQPTSLRTTLADGTHHLRSGLVAEAHSLGGDGGLVRYRLRLVPWSWFMGQSRHSRVFQEQSLLDILEIVFNAYRPMAAWRLTDELGPFLADVRHRSYCVQYRETDAAFVHRLLAEEGIGTRIEQDPESPCGHTLVLFADSRLSPDTPQAETTGIRFHRADATEHNDTVQALGGHHTLGATHLTTLSNDYKTHRATGSRIPLNDARPDQLARLDWYEPAGAYAYANNTEADRYARLAAQAIESTHSIWIGRSSLRELRSGTGFALQDAPINPTHPRATPNDLLITDIQHIGINNLPKAMQDAVTTHPGPTPAIHNAHGVRQPLDPAALKQAEAGGYGNSFHAVPRQRPWRPILDDDTGVRINPRPTALGIQTAIVTGPDGSTVPHGHHAVHTDRLGRIRVRFHWQNDDDTTQDSCWLRVVQRAAGPQGGQQFIPRIGSEVLVQFLGGDIDRPVVMGALYNGQGEAGITPTPGGQNSHTQQNRQARELYGQATDHRPSAQGNLAGGHSPAWHGAGNGHDAHRHAGALSGIKTQEFGGFGYNQLVFDDTDDQQRIQFATTHHTSQLNLGHLIHQADNYRGSFRGLGWELRTDGYGAVRGQSGVLVTTYPNAETEPAGDATGPTALARQHGMLAKALSKAAGIHKTVSIAGHEGVDETNQSRLDEHCAPLTAQYNNLRSVVLGTRYAQAKQQGSSTVPEPKTLPHSGAGTVTLAGRDGIGIIAGQALQAAAGDTLDIASGKNTHAAISGDLRIHSGQAIGWLAGAQGNGELKLATANSDLTVQAQHDTLDLKAKGDLTIVSNNAEVDFAAHKKIRLAVAGGASITIENGEISVNAPGTMTIHASQTAFEGPTQLSREMNEWPETKFDDRYIVRSRSTGRPMTHTRVEIRRADGARIQATTDAEGCLPRQKSQALENVTIHVLHDDNAEQP